MLTKTKKQAPVKKIPVLRALCNKCNGTGKTQILPRWAPEGASRGRVEVLCVPCLGTGRIYP